MPVGAPGMEQGAGSEPYDVAPLSADPAREASILAELAERVAILAHRLAGILKLGLERERCLRLGSQLLVREEEQAREWRAASENLSP